MTPMAAIMGQQRLPWFPLLQFMVGIMAAAQATGIRYGTSFHPAARDAVADFQAQIHQDNMALVVVYCSVSYDRQELAHALQSAFGDVLVVGCTTAGELTNQGYCTGTLTGFSLAGSDFYAEAVMFDGLRSFSFSRGIDTARALNASMAARFGDRFQDQVFAMVLVDGLSGAEDSMLSALHAALQGIPVMGGSAGDDLALLETYVYKDGTFYSDAAVLTLVQTTRPFRVFKTQHFVGTSQKMVITEANPLKRIVSEINAEPAAYELARILGMDISDLNHKVFASHPLVVRVGGDDYVRSIQQVYPDGSLQFYCAIDEGLVLSVARAINPIDNLEQVLQSIEDQIGKPQIVVAFECVLRQLEMEMSGYKDQMGQVLASHHVIGFCTYGEQFNAMHVNQSLTGIAIAEGWT